MTRHKLHDSLIIDKNVPNYNSLGNIWKRLKN